MQNKKEVSNKVKNYKLLKGSIQLKGVKEITEGK